MSAPSSNRQSPNGNFEIKGSSINLPSLKILIGDVNAVMTSLQEKIQQAPEFFRDAPIVIDLQALDDSIDLVGLCASLRACGLVPVGIRGGDSLARNAAKQAHLAVFSDQRNDLPVASPVPDKPAVETPPQPRPIPPDPVSTKIVQQPIRSGQRIYAMGADLVVLAPVSAGAEIMADGNIHVYGSLRGRALAGVQGNLSSRIFCLDLQAELVSIGGHYKVSENLDDSVRNRPVQIYLNNNSLIIEDL